MIWKIMQIMTSMFFFPRTCLRMCFIKRKTNPPHSLHCHELAQGQGADTYKFRIILQIYLIIHELYSWAPVSSLCSFLQHAFLATLSSNPSHTQTNWLLYLLVCTWCYHSLNLTWDLFSFLNKMPLFCHWILDKVYTRILSL